MIRWLIQSKNRRRPMTPLEEKALLDRLLRAKLALEKSLFPKVRAALRGVVSAFQRSYAQTSTPPPTEPHAEKLSGIFRRHYLAVGRVFRNTVANGVRVGLAPGQDVIRDIAYRQWVDQQAPIQALRVVRTSLRYMAVSVPKAAALLAADGEAVTPQSLSLRVARLAYFNANQRAPGISTYETQASAEMIRYMEAQVVAGLAPRGTAHNPGDQRKVHKTWQSQEDEAVRMWHVEANGQTQLVGVPFIVGGQRLMVPGDLSLGATIANVIRCRCSAIYGIGDP